MEADLAIKNGFLVMPGEGVIHGTLAIKDEKIAGIIADASLVKAREEIDASGLYVFPGIVQPHAHLGGGEDMEDFAAETRSAAIGGVTTVMVYYRETGACGSKFCEKVGKAAGLSHIDFAYHLQIMSDEQIENVPRCLAEFGVSSFKFNMGYKGAEAKEKDIFELTDGVMYEGFKKIGEQPGMTACVHAENSEIIAYRTAKLREQGRDDMIAWSESRPSHAEEEAIKRALYFSELAGCPLYVAHTTTAEGLRMIREHRKKGGAKVFIETCPQYLTHHMNSPVGRTGKFIPPLRTAADNEALWQGLMKGEIDAIGIDQGARKVEPESVSIWERKTTPREAVTALPVLLTEGFHRRGLPLERIAAVTSSNPAKIFNLFPRKGSLQAGSDADAAVVDIDLEKTVTKDVVRSSSDFSIYEGWKLKGWPVMTVSRGRIVMRGGEPVGERGWGKYMERRPWRP